MKSKYPEHYIVGERPVKVVETENGGLTCLAYNWETGELERDMSYMLKVRTMEGEVNAVSEEKFNIHVENLRAKLKNND
ncbi:hypothetical protein RIVM261_079480 [Rivularia sp. IAM M-261]|nr:hypothetical protein RIVM261_079480 [Rivularia sp. IAM M-261]